MALVLVLDRSGSMTGQPLAMAKAGAERAVQALAKEDAIAIITFDGQPLHAVELVAVGTSRAALGAGIARITPGGGTEIRPALELARDDLARAQACRKHVALLTDGAAPTAGIEDLVRGMAGDGITVSTVALGSSADTILLQRVAELGHGRYYAVVDPGNLPAIFEKEVESAHRR